MITLAKRPPIAERLLMLSRTPKLPEPLLHLKMPPCELAQRFNEINVPSHIVKEILMSGAMQHGAWIVSMENRAFAFKAETPWHEMLAKVMGD